MPVNAVNKQQPLETTTATTAIRAGDDVWQRLQQLSDDIHVARQTEVNLLSRLVSRHDVWAALRNEKDPHFVAHVQQEMKLQQQQQQPPKEPFTPKTALAPSQTEKDDEETTSTISFGEFSNMETDAKRARIRQGLLRQRDKIKSLLQRMKQRRAGLSSASALSKGTANKK